MKDLINFDTEAFPILSKKDSQELCVYIKAENPDVLISDFNTENLNLLKCFYLSYSEGGASINFEHYEDLPFSSLEMVWLE